MAKTLIRVVAEGAVRRPHAMRLRQVVMASAVGVGVVAGLCAAGAGPASAAPAVVTAYGTATETVTAVIQNGQITVTVQGLTPGETVSIYIASTPTLLGSATANSAGVVTATYPLPAGLAAGMHTVTVTGSGTNLSATVSLTSATGPAAIPADPANPADPASSSTQLSYTGADIAATTGIGAALVAGGGLLVLSSRRRRRASIAS